MKWRIEQNTKRRFLTGLATVIKKDPTILIRKHTNELKIHKKTLRRAIKQDSSLDRNPLDYAT